MTNSYLIESPRPFSESLIWDLNRKYYQDIGIAAWQNDKVPHHLTSNSMVGDTYAELIFAFLSDLGRKGNIIDTVYILELGAGHGKLAFHIIMHLDRLIFESKRPVPPYCLILSDIVEKNLAFFDQHPQFQPFFDNGTLDIAYFDAIGGDKLELRKAGKAIKSSELNQPIIALANYFFDSLPIDVYLYRNGDIKECHIGLKSDAETTVDNLKIEDINLEYKIVPLKKDRYDDPLTNEIVQDYSEQVFNSFIFIPDLGLQCINNVRKLSTKGVMFISMDKGFHEIHDLENTPQPELVLHESFSLSVNYHAISSYCKKSGGLALLPDSSNFYLDLGCFLFLENADTYNETSCKYQRVVNDFGPDDFNEFKGFFYKHITLANLQELFGLLRISAYDSTIFYHLLPRIKQLTSTITFNERRRLHQTMAKVWSNHFELELGFDIALEIGGLHYDLGFFDDALEYYHKSANLRGLSAMGYYNLALCYYQLRLDTMFISTVAEGRSHFPDFGGYDNLDHLDLGAK